MFRDTPAINRVNPELLIWLQSLYNWALACLFSLMVTECPHSSHTCIFSDPHTNFSLFSPPSQIVLPALDTISIIKWPIPAHLTRLEKDPYSESLPWPIDYYGLSKCLELPLSLILISFSSNNSSQQCHLLRWTLSLEMAWPCLNLQHLAWNMALIRSIINSC